MRTEIHIEIGGEGDPVEIPVKIVGCGCRADDFVMAVSKFARDWRKDADGRKSQIEGAPCGCNDAQ